MACCGCFTKKPKSSVAEPRPLPKKELSITPGSNYNDVIEYQVPVHATKLTKKSIQRAATELQNDVPQSNNENAKSPSYSRGPKRMIEHLKQPALEVSEIQEENPLTPSAAANNVKNITLTK